MGSIPVKSPRKLSWWGVVPVGSSPRKELSWWGVVRTILHRSCFIKNLGRVYHHTSGVELRFPDDFQGDFCR